MQYYIFTDQELNTIYNRSKEYLDNFKKDYYAKQANEREESRKPITGNIVDLTLPRHEEPQINFDLYGSIVAFRECLRYLNEKHMDHDQ